MPTTRTIVLKFGSSVIPTPAAIPGAVEEIGRWRSRGYRVVAVVSALAGTTDALIARAKSLSTAPEPFALAALLATGEAEAVALLTLALNAAGIAANALDPGALDLCTTGPALDAAPLSVNVHCAFRALEDRPVLIVPGFIGRDAIGRATCLGRGGSDLSALFIARALNAECHLLKDVDGLYDRDPAADTAARRYVAARWDDVLDLDEGIVQHKAVRFARDHGLAFTVAAIGRDYGTLVGPGPTRFDEALAASEQECAA